MANRWPDQVTALLRLRSAPLVRAAALLLPGSPAGRLDGSGIVTVIDGVLVAYGVAISRLAATLPVRQGAHGEQPVRLCSINRRTARETMGLQAVGRHQNRGSNRAIRRAVHGP